MPHRNDTDSPDTTRLESPAPGVPGVSAPTPEPGRKVDLSTAKVGAAAAASVTTSLAASFFGTAGTLIGAAIGAVVSTVAGAIYESSMRRAADRVRTTQAIVVRRTEVGPTARTGAPSVAPDPTRTPAAVAAVCALAFVIAIGAITAAESLLHTTVGGKSGTTVGRVFGDDGSSSRQDEPATTPTATSTPAPTDRASASATRTAVASTPDPSTTAPTTAPTAAPSTTAPSTAGTSAAERTGTP